MDAFKLTLVFPCFHAAKHMQHVLEDIQAQTFPDFEAILVNDGDDSQTEAMEQIKAKDHRIRIIKLDHNCGVAAARNAGTDAATTKWVTYPDPDDRFGANYVKKLYEAVDGGDAMMACGGYSLIDIIKKECTYRYLKIDQSPIVYDSGQSYELMLSAFAHSYAWNKLYNVELMRKLKLRQDTNFLSTQDDAFNIKYLTNITKIGLIKDCEYTYYQYDGNTASKRYNPKLNQNILELANLRQQLHRKLNWPEERIIETKNKELAYNVLRMIKNYFAYNSPLTLCDVTKSIQNEILSQPVLVNAVMERDFDRDYVMLLVQKLIGIRNAKLIATTFKVLVVLKKKFSYLYSKLTPIFRGE